MLCIGWVSGAREAVFWFSACGDIVIIKSVFCRLPLVEPLNLKHLDVSDTESVSSYTSTVYTPRFNTLTPPDSGRKRKFVPHLTPLYRAVICSKVRHHDFSTPVLGGPRIGKSILDDPSSFLLRMTEITRVDLISEYLLSSSAQGLLHSYYLSGLLSFTGVCAVCTQLRSH